MAPLPNISGAFRVTLEWSSFGGITPRNVLGFVGNPGDIDLLGAALQDHLTSEMFTSLSSNYALPTVSIIDLSAGAASKQYPIGGGLSGLATGDIVPSTACVVSFKTLIRGPRGRGRIYIGPVTEPAIAGGSLVSGAASDITDAWTTFLSDMAGSDFQLGVISLTHADINAVASASCDELVGTQRRRQDQLR